MRGREGGREERRGRGRRRAVLFTVEIKLKEMMATKERALLIKVTYYEKTNKRIIRCSCGGPSTCAYMSRAFFYILH